MASILHTPEIMMEVMALSSQSTRVASARVCHLWSELAINEIWCRLDSIIPLLELLAPIKYDKQGECAFAYQVHYANWQRFESYAARIKSLKWAGIKELRGSFHPLSDSIITQLLILRPSKAPFFPRLRNINWVAKSDKALLQLLALLPKSVTKPDSYAGSKCSSYVLSGVLDFIRQDYLPLQQISLIHPFHIHQIEYPLSNLLKGQTQLSQVTIERICSSEKAISVLGGLPNLQAVLKFTDPTPLEDKVIQWEFRPGYFQKLETLHFSISLSQAATAFGSTMPPLLDSVLICNPHSSPVRSIDLHLCLTNLMVSCPRLAHLQLELFSTNIIAEQLRFESFAPLMHCHGLVTLSVGHKKPIVLVEENVNEMARAWPWLTDISMAADPSECSGTGTSLSIIKLFATYFHRNLTHLGLFFSVDRDEMASYTTSSTPFQQLVTLNMGTSAVSSSDRVAVVEFLAAMLSRTIEIQIGMGEGSPTLDSMDDP
ncbi:hypothetical protein FRB93_005929 [Tulasnella sp. JGI-2019a]|nr:hypothetical protein FRB93_005929 [Tulasnella sp. JGI-2019a]